VHFRHTGTDEREFLLTESEAVEEVLVKRGRDELTEPPLFLLLFLLPFLLLFLLLRLLFAFPLLHIAPEGTAVDEEFDA
jgi:hypothetical protein